MLLYTANIAFLFADRPFLKRITAAKEAGFERVECHFPYEHPVEELREHLDRAGVQLTGLNTAPGPSPEDWGLAGVPGREAAFREGFEQALAYATSLSASVIHVMAGIVPPEERAAARKTYVANMRWAGERAAGTGVTLVLEPLNTRDKPGYLVSRSDEIADILAEIDRPEVKLLFDVYHIQIMEGDVLTRLARHWDRIGHVQIAAVPSRAEPDEGEVNYAAVLDALDARGWDGFVGLEYKPRSRTEDGLAWLKTFGRALKQES
jgi:2-dehydrotetronate isomerase